MLAKHVEAKVLQHLQIVLHSLTIRWRVEAIWPVPLIESTELEDKLSVEEWALNTINLAPAYGTESSVTADDIVTEAHADIVERGRVWTPKIGIFCFEAKCGVGRATVAGKLAAIGVHDFYLNLCGSIVGSIDGGVD